MHPNRGSKMRFLFRFFTSTKTFTEKVSELEKKIIYLETQLETVKMANNKPVPAKSTEKPKENQPNIKIEHLQVDQIIIEKVDYANNFGQLGIRDLSGRLNIGTSYEGNISKQVEEHIEEKIQEKLGKMAKVHFRAKEET